MEFKEESISQSELVKNAKHELGLLSTRAAELGVDIKKETETVCQLLEGEIDYYKLPLYRKGLSDPERTHIRKLNAMFESWVKPDAQVEANKAGDDGGVLKEISRATVFEGVKLRCVLVSDEGYEISLQRVK